MKCEDNNITDTGRALKIVQIRLFGYVIPEKSKFVLLFNALHVEVWHISNFKTVDSINVLGVTLKMNDY